MEIKPLTYKWLSALMCYPESDLLEALPELQAALSGVKSVLIQEITLFDVYRGAGLPENHKSMALKVILQSTEDTLTDEVVEPIVAELVAAAEGIGAKLRA